ncbi:MAG: right-handed parallel beta-helix repeat-containing protein [Bacteroidales bacterium]|jgi:hypothetical protein|nr:right-handed parallel beta-helix repeat-containing protein [Bacteroidales bacterium]
MNGGYAGFNVYGGYSASAGLCGTNFIIDSNVMTNVYYYGIQLYYANFMSCSYNTILSRTTNLGSNFNALAIYNCSGPFIIGNRIIQRASVIYPYGMILQSISYMSQTQNKTLVANNEIILSSNGSSGSQYGLQIGNSALDIINNSIYVSIERSSLVAFGGIYVSNPNNNTVIKNNNIVSTAKTGYPIYINGTGLNYSNYDIDYNNLYAPTFVGYAEGAIRTIIDWQKRFPSDRHSIRILVDFVDTTSNLALSNYNPLLNCYLIPSVNKDLKDSNRLPITTMGCYEQNALKTGDGALIEIYGLKNGALAGTNDSVYAVFFNKGTTAINSVNIGWSFNGTQSSKTISTTGKLDTLFVGILTYASGENNVQVWINNLNGGALTDELRINDTVKASAIGCPNALGGVINVSKTGTYTSIKQVTDLLAVCGLSSDVTVILDNGIYEENVEFININISGSYSLTLTSTTGNPAGVIIRPTSETGILIENTNNIKIQNITIDALNGMRGIELTGISSNIFIDNCIILVDSSKVYGTFLHNTYAGIYKSNSGLIGLTGLTVKNCNIQGGYSGIYLQGTSANYYQNIIIDSNIITGQYYYGLSINYVDLNSVSYNQIRPLYPHTGSTWYGLYFSYVRNGGIIGNRIRSNEMPILWGIYLSNINYTLIANNEIYFYKTSTAASVYGIYTTNTNAIKCLHNSILLTGGSGTGIAPANIYVSTSATYGRSTYKNNNFVRNGTSGYAVRLSAAPGTTFAQYNDIDYNNYYTIGTDLGYAGSAKATLALWQTAVPTDIHSVNIQPVFVNTVNSLELANDASNAGLTCPYYLGVGKDINENFRLSTTTMGAYNMDMSNAVFDLRLQKVICKDTSVVYPNTVPVKVEIANIGNSTDINSAIFGWSINGELQTPYTWTTANPLAPGNNIEIPVGTFSVDKTSSFDIVVWIESVNGGKDSILLNDTASLSVNVFWTNNNLVLQSIEPLVAAGSLCTDDYVPFKIKVENTGASDYNFASNPTTFSIRVTQPAAYSLDTVISTGIIKSGESAILTLTDTFSIVTAGQYDIRVWIDSINPVVYDDSLALDYISGKFGLPIDADFSSEIPMVFMSEGTDPAHKWELVTQGTGADSVVKPQFGTGMLSFGGDFGSMTTLSTRQLDLSRTVQPSLSFWYFHDTIPCDDYTDVRVTIDGGITYNTLFSLTKYDAIYGWRQYSMDLPPYVINECVTLLFEAMEKSYSGDVTQYIDRIRILAKQDIAITDILIPEYDVCDLKNKELKVVLSNLTDPILDYVSTPVIVTLEVKETGQTFTKTLTSDTLAGFATDTITLATGFDLGKDTYTFKAYFSSLLDVDRDNDTLETSLTINPGLSVAINQLSGSNCLQGEMPIYQEITLTNTGNMDLFDIDLILQIDTGETGSPAYFRFTETCTDTIHADSSFTYIFKNAYTVPWVVDYYPRVYAYLSCDSALVNATTATVECVNMKDLYIVSIDNPTTGNDTIEKTVYVTASVRNRDDLSEFTNAKISVLIRNSQGIQTETFTETISKIGILSTESHTFTRSYTIPDDSVYYLTVYTDSYDMYGSNDTLTVKRITLIDSTDLSVVNIDNPAMENDTIGEVIHVTASLYNSSKYKDFAAVNITVRVTNSQGLETETFTETIGNIGALSRVSHIFSRSYTVPNDSVYYLSVYIESYDKYSHNDTLILTRNTVTKKDVGITPTGAINAFTLGQNIPNPATNSTRIDYSVPEAGEVIFHVHSIHGQLLYSKTIDTKRGTNSIELNTTTFAAGVYFYSMEYKGQRLVRQLIINATN